MTNKENNQYEVSSAMRDKILCENCEKNLATEFHTCPYAEEINDDHRSLCTCCNECTHECAMDI